MSSPIYAELVDLYVEAYREGFNRVDKTIPVSSQKIWVRNYAKSVVSEAVPALNAYAAAIRSKTVAKSDLALTGGAMYSAIKKLNLWPGSRTAKRTRQIPLAAYEKVAQEVGWVPSDKICATLMGVTVEAVRNKRVGLSPYYDFSPDGQHFAVTHKQAPIVISEDSLTRLVAGLVRKAVEEIRG